MHPPPSRPRARTAGGPAAPGLDRRAFLGRTVVVGAATWAVPTILSTTPVAAATGSCSTVTVHEFSGGLDGWTIDNGWGPGVDGLWRHTRHPRRDRGALHYGRGIGGDYRTGNSRNSGRVVSPPFSVPATGTREVRFTVWREVEVQDPGYDRFRLVINGSTSQVLYSVSSIGDTNGFETYTVAIPAQYAGETVTFQFDFDTIDGLYNRHEGIYVARFEVTACPVVAPGAAVPGLGGAELDSAPVIGAEPEPPPRG